MKNKLKQLYEWLILLAHSAMSLISVCFFSSFCVSGHIKSLRNRKRGEVAYVLANGPSLTEALNEESRRIEFSYNDSIVMNRFASSEYFYVIKPRYYILLDPEFYDETHLQTHENDKRMFEVMNEIDWDMILFLVHGYKTDILKEMFANPLIHIVQYNGTKIIGFKNLQNRLYGWNLGIPSSRNVIIPAILLMANLGYEKVYLYGAEFSWTKMIDVDPRNNRVFLNDRHFYENNALSYYAKGWYKNYLDAIVDMLNGTEQIAKYAESKHVKIINRTKGSFIDAFEYEPSEP